MSMLSFEHKVIKDRTCVLTKPRNSTKATVSKLLRGSFRTRHVLYTLTQHNFRSRSEYRLKRFFDCPQANSPSHSCSIHSEIHSPLVLVFAMPYSLQKRNVLVTGGSRGLGALICEKFAAEGCNVAVNFASNADAANILADNIQQQYGVKTCTVKGDAGIAEDNTRLVRETVDKLGGLDIIVANAGWTRMTRVGDIYAMSLEDWNKCWAINVMSHLQLVQEAAPIFKANTDGGVYLITSSVAGISTLGSSVAYSVTKAAGLQLMKNLAFSQGPKIRINAVLPGLLLTEWGQKFPEQVIAGLKNRATLKHETFLEDCADAFISLAKNNSTTGQQIVVDSGLVLGSIPQPGTVLPSL